MRIRSHRSIPVAALAVILSTLVPSAPAAAQFPSELADNVLSEVRIFVDESA